MTTKHDREPAAAAGEEAAVTRAWHEASEEQPPAQLDAAILEAARRSIEVEAEGETTRRVQQPARSRWMQWQPLAAAATVAGLAFVLLQTLPREREVAPPIRIQAPEATPEREVWAGAQGGAPEPARAPDMSPEPRSSAPSSGVTEAPSGPDTSPPTRQRGEAGANRSLPTEAADVVDAMPPAAPDQRMGVMPDAAGEAYSPEAAAPAMERSATRALGIVPTPSAADWAARIEALHASGDLAAAAAALRAFRAVDPDADARLPESLRAWAQTVE